LALEARQDLPGAYAAFERAVAIEPDNKDYRAALRRLTPSEPAK
jgi:hypothetical protein